MTDETTGVTCPFCGAAAMRHLESVGWHVCRECGQFVTEALAEDTRAMESLRQRALSRRAFAPEEE